MPHPIKVGHVFEVGIQGLNYVGNGQPAIAECPANLARFFNMCAGKRKKRLFARALEMSQTAGLPSATSFVGSFRTSATVKSVTVAMLCAPVQSTDSTLTPRLRWVLTEDPLGSPSTINQPYVHFGRRKTGTVTPSDLSLVTQTWDGRNGTTALSGNALYVCSMSRADYARVIAVCIWENPVESAPANTATFAPSANFALSSPIVDTPLASLRNVQNLWKFQGSPIWSWSFTDGGEVSTSGTSFTNIYDSSQTAYGTNTVGHWASPRYQGTFESNNVPISFIVQARDSGSNGTVVFVSSTGTLATVTVNKNVSSYFYASGTLSATLDHQKIDTLYKTASGTHTLILTHTACYNSSGEE